MIYYRAVLISIGKDNDVNFLKGDVKKLYFTLLASSIGSTLVTNIYSTVDSVAIGHYAGPVGSAAISCINPLWPLMLVFGVITGIGGAVMMNNRRGAGNERDANEFFTLSMLISLIAATAVGVTFLFFMEPLLKFFGAEGAVLSFALEYAKPIAIVSPTFTLCMTASCFVRNDGEAALPTIATVAGGIFNIFGDIFFVFDFGLGLGAFGAGLATALGQLVSFLIIISYFFSKKCKLRFTKISRPVSKISSVFSVGASAGITEMSFFATTVVFNKIIIDNLGETHLAIYGVASTFSVLICCFFYATGNALQPIVAANWGAKSPTRVKKTLKVSLITSAALGAIFFAAAECFPTFILKMYMDLTPQALEIGPNIMRTYSSGMFLVGISVVSSYYLQASLNRVPASVISALRGVILPIFLALILPLAFDYSAIWWAVPLAELITAFISIIFLIFAEKKKRLSHLEISE